MSMLCEECEDRKTCKKTCTKAEEYISHQHVNKRESTLTESNIYSIEGISDAGMFDISASIYTEEIAAFQFLSPLENKIVSMFYLQRKTYKGIARALSGGRGRNRLNQRGVKHRLSKARAKIMSHFSNSEVSGHPKDKLLKISKNRL